MCGRYANHLQNMSAWSDILGDWPGGMALSADIAPGQMIPVVVDQSGTPACRAMHWGLLPAWSKTHRLKYATYNARLESVREKPAFRGAYKKSQSCLIPASAYYEWSGEKGHKTRYTIALENDMPLFMAGLWDFWEQGEENLYSCTILTRPAVNSIIKIHPRMPLILNRGEALAWLQKPGEQPTHNALDYIRRRKAYPLIVSQPGGDRA